MIDVKKAYISFNLPIESVPILEYLNEAYETDAIEDGHLYKALLIYKVSSSGVVAYIKDLFCNKNLRECVRTLSRRISDRNESVKFLKFHRRLKHYDNGTLIYKIERFMR
jgi:hypothetical protein